MSLKVREATLTGKPNLCDEPVNTRYTGQSMVDVCQKFGKWVVDPQGNMVYDGGRYSIDNSDLNDDDWICHLFEKAWIDWNEFMPAYFTACKINKIEHIRLRVFYKSALKQ